MRYSEAHTDAASFQLVREWKDCGVVARFTVDGEPVSKARARFTGYGSKVRSYTPEKTLTAERRVALAFKQAAHGYEIETGRTYGVTALFFHATRQRRDVDNMLKLILDGLNGLAWQDDSQVVEVSGRKCLEQPEHARTEVVIYYVGGEQRLTIGCAYCGQHFPVYPGSTRQFCSRKCAYASRVKERPACAVCGEPCKDIGAKTCSIPCRNTAHARRYAAKRKPPPRCGQCAAAVSKPEYKLCRDCYEARGERKDIA